MIENTLSFFVFVFLHTPQKTSSKATIGKEKAKKIEDFVEVQTRSLKYSILNITCSINYPGIYKCSLMAWENSTLLSLKALFKTSSVLKTHGGLHVWH